jgi:hypothetical protein
MKVFGMLVTLFAAATAAEDVYAVTKEELPLSLRGKSGNRNGGHLAVAGE